MKYLFVEINYSNKARFKIKNVCYITDMCINNMHVV